MHLTAQPFRSTVLHMEKAGPTMAMKVPVFGWSQAPLLIVKRFGSLSPREFVERSRQIFQKEKYFDVFQTDEIQSVLARELLPAKSASYSLRSSTECRVPCTWCLRSAYVQVVCIGKNFHWIDWLVHRCSSQ